LSNLAFSSAGWCLGPTFALRDATTVFRPLKIFGHAAHSQTQINWASFSSNVPLYPQSRHRNLACTPTPKTDCARERQRGLANFL
jgi:hypothetical protein